MVWLKGCAELLKYRGIWVFIVVKRYMPRHKDRCVGSCTLPQLRAHFRTPYAIKGLPLFSDAVAEMAATECWK
jgi:hypothetical protein